MRNSTPILAILWCCLFVLFGLQQVQATHIVGGEINYRCLGNDEYEITLTVFRDCDTGVPWFDDPAAVSVYRGQGGTGTTLFRNLQLDLSTINDTLDIVLEDPCLTINSTACIHTTTYTDTVNLPFSATGYTIAYQRCCRNRDIVNIIDPQASGATYWTYISPAALTGCNSSATFNEWPRVYLCNGVPVLIDHAATDVDGDSIVYELCTPSDGDFPFSPAPSPADPPPYVTVSWRPGYSTINMLGGADPLRIDPQTGLIEGTPSINGVFLVGVCLREYRNGQLISTSRRDFQHIVGPCQINTVAAFDTFLPPCNNTLNYTFPNRSFAVSGGYQWLYDSLSTSNSVNGTYIFPDTGRYTVRLVAGVGSPCLDTATVEIDARIRAAQLTPLTPLIGCLGDTVDFTSLNTLAGFATSTDYQWSPVGSLVSGQGTPTARFLANQNQTIRVVATNNYGCSSVAATSLIVQSVEADFNFSIPPCNDNLNITFQNQSTSSPPTNNYQWDFGGQGSTNTTNPVFTFPDTGTYNIQLIAGVNTPCPDTLTLPANLQLQAIDLDPLPDLSLCNGDLRGVQVNNRFANYTPSTTYTWSPANLIQSGQGTDSVGVVANGTTTVQVVGINSFGCADSTTFDLTTTVVEAAFDTLNLICNTSLVVPFLNRSTTNVTPISYQWDAFGVSSATSTNATFTFPDTGNYQVQLIAGGNTPCPDTADISFYLPLFGVDLQTLASPTVCVGDSVWLKVEDALEDYSSSIQYTWSPSTAIQAGQGTDSVLVIPNGPITIRVDALNSHLCPDSIETTIEVEIVEAAFDSVDLICNTSLTLPFLNRSTSNLNTVQYDWRVSNGDGSTTADPTFVFADTGVYNVQLIAGTNSICPDTIEQTFRLPLEGVDLSAPDVTVFCRGDTVELTVVDALEAYSASIQYQWLPGPAIITGQGTDTATAFLDQPNTIYRVVGLNSFGCIDTAELVGTILYPSPTLAISSNPDSIFVGQSVQLTATDDATYIYNWVPDTTLSALDVYNPVARPRQSTFYILTVENTLGCKTTDSILVPIRAPICGDPVVFIPNAFSPDGDGYNDELMVNGNNITDLTLEIYNRWGQRVFATTALNQGWDGRFQGAELPPDVYGYYFKCVCDDGSTFFKKGNITLLR